MRNGSEPDFTQQVECQPGTTLRRKQARGVRWVMNGKRVTRECARDDTAAQRCTWMVPLLIGGGIGACQTDAPGTNPVSKSVCFSLDGKLLAWEGWEGRVHLQDVDTGQNVAMLAGQGGRIQCVAFSQDSNLIAVLGGLNRELCLWDIKTGRKSDDAFKGHHGSINHVAWTRHIDGTPMLVTASDDKTVGLWSVSGQLQGTFRGHDNRVLFVACSHDSRLVASTSDDKTARVWKISGVLAYTLEGHTASCTSLAFSKDSGILATCSDDNTVKIWQLGECTATMTGLLDGILGLSWSLDGKTLYSVSKTATMRAWSDDGLEVGMLQLQMGALNSAAWSPEGATMAFTMTDLTMQVWRACESQKNLARHVHEARVMSIVYAANGKKFLSAGIDGSVNVCKADQKVMMSQIREASYGITHVVLNTEGTHIAVATTDAIVQVWQVLDTTAQLVCTLREFRCVSYLRFSNTGETLACGEHDGSLATVNSSSQWCSGESTINEHRKNEHDARILCVAFSEDGKTLASGSCDMTIVVWDTSAYQKVMKNRLTGHSGAVHCVAFDKTGNMLASSGEDYLVLLWNLLKEDAVPRKFVRHTNIVTLLAWNSDSTLVASGGRDKIVCVWKVESHGGEVHAIIAGYSAELTCMAFSPCGKCITSACADGSIQHVQLQGVGAASQPFFFEANEEVSECNPVCTRAYVMTHVMRPPALLSAPEVKAGYPAVASDAKRRHKVSVQSKVKQHTHQSEEVTQEAQGVRRGENVQRKCPKITMGNLQRAYLDVFAHHNVAIAPRNLTFIKPQKEEMSFQKATQMPTQWTAGSTQQNSHGLESRTVVNNSRTSGSVDSKEASEKAARDARVIAAGATCATHTSDVMVVVRVRPFLGGEISHNKISVGAKSVKLNLGMGDDFGMTYNIFNFDRVFDMKADNQSLMRHASEAAVSELTRGVNSMICAYGQTGSGKTYTLLGEGKETRGIAQATFELLHFRLDGVSKEQSKSGVYISFEFECSMLQVYQDVVYDLLCEKGTTKLDLISDMQHTCKTRPAAKRVKCGTRAHLEALLYSGLEKRKSRSTLMNDKSSRSHLIMFVHVMRKRKESSPKHHSTLTIVDLAGNERAFVHTTVKRNAPTRLEALSINKSLVSLNMCLQAAAKLSQKDANNNTYINFRSSTLTRLLQMPLQGAKIYFLACCSPLETQLEATKLTLSYANQIKNIKTSAETTALFCQPNLEGTAIKMVSLDELRKHGCIPRSSDHRHVLLQNLFVDTVRIFVSHRWLRPNDTPPHPDDAGRQKYDLVLEAIDRMQKEGWLPSDDTRIALWMDFACIDQDQENPAAELNDRMVQFVGLCDVMLTPVVDRGWFEWAGNKSIKELMEGCHALVAYKAPAWEHYTSRGWCRLEFFFNGNVKSEKRAAKHLGGALKGAVLEGRRPHIIFGHREFDRGELPIILPAVADSLYDDYHPEKGYLFDHNDRAVIRANVTVLEGINSNLKKLQDDMKAEAKPTADAKAKTRIEAEAEAEAAERARAGPGCLNAEEFKVLYLSIWMRISEENNTTLLSRFVAEPKDLCGELDDAVMGFYYLMKVDKEEIMAKVDEGVAAIEAEVKALGNSDVIQHLEYILRQPASEQEYDNGVRDKGHAGMCLQDFVNHQYAKSARLKEAEVAALRLCTTSTFQHINNPLRDRASSSPHPLPVTVELIIRGIKKLRRVGGVQRRQSQVSWRGMRNARVTDDFADKGVTELALLSATSDIATAVRYSMSNESLILKIVAHNNLQLGVDLQWLSVFPNEAEILYPPLTYLQPTGRNEIIQVKGYKFTVVEVHPTIS